MTKINGSRLVAQGFSPDIYMPSSFYMLQNTKPYPRRPRLLEKGYYNGGGRYFVTICTANKIPIFTKPNIIKSMINYLSMVAKNEKMSVIIYCFMPNHLHLLLRGNTDQSNLLRFISKYKQLTGYNFAKAHRNKLWGTSFYDHVLRGEESEPKISRYILENPVRKGLSETIFDYPYSGSLEFNAEELAAYISLN